MPEDDLEQQWVYNPNVLDKSTMSRDSFVERPMVNMLIRHPNQKTLLKGVESFGSEKRFKEQ